MFFLPMSLGPISSWLMPLLETEDIGRMVCPIRSPVKPDRASLGCFREQVASQRYPPITLQNLRTAVQ